MRGGGSWCPWSRTDHKPAVRGVKKKKKIMSQAQDKSSGDDGGDDCDIDTLLASLTAAEVEELGTELMDIDPDPEVPVGLRQRNQTEKKPSVQYDRGAMLDFCEQETKKLIQREMSFERTTQPSPLPQAGEKPERKLQGNATLLKLGYHYELARPRMTTTHILSRNMNQQCRRQMLRQETG
ncbi:leiomodin 1a (smooth muscle) [Diretmus argenteus]